MNNRLAQTLLLQALWFLFRDNVTTSLEEKQAWRSKAITFLEILDPSPTQAEADFLETQFPW